MEDQHHFSFKLVRKISIGLNKENKEVKIEFPIHPFKLSLLILKKELFDFVSFVLYKQIHLKV